MRTLGHIAGFDRVPLSFPLSFRPNGRRAACFRSLFVLGLASLAGCTSGNQAENAIGKPDGLWGRRGISDGRFQKPRAMTIDADDNLYVVDMTARIQVFTPEGKFLRGWQTPTHANGRPTGLGMDRDGNLLVADTHYFRLLIYSPDGELLRQIGGVNGQGPGEFGFVTDAVQTKNGDYVISEYGEFDRVQVFTREGKFIRQWGGHGEEPGKFSRPQALVLDREEKLWVADACNHRIQKFDLNGDLLQVWGEHGDAVGELSYPYGITFDDDENLLVCEFGNHRVQKFTKEGKSLGFWGHRGRKEGELDSPWTIVKDSRGRAHVLDTGNHRVQRVWM